MRVFLGLLITLTMFISCVGTPPSGNNGSNVPTHNRQTVPSAIKVGHLDTRVHNLSIEIEKKYNSKNHSEEDVREWIHLIVDYIMEYATSTSTLTDKQCAAIEYDFGKIAGLMCNMVSDPIEAFGQELEEYASRRENWDDAAENGFESVISPLWEF